ncbi:hypothetical protein EsDP_00005553 [Epichloe bromicola]|uniref:Chromo domain-containing protein n=1 Tax=Epichloe bromicola TaxID=79588 RepID=A0ABQ0CV02_9HYPO
MESIALSHSSDEELHTPEPPVTARKPSPRSKFTVAIRPRPKYVPGTGPALQPLRLLPSAASTGYIIERILLPSPGLAADGRPLPKRMAYVVGWHDLPAASLLIPAMQILHYVSPRALEEWENRLEVEMDEDRRDLSNVIGGARRPRQDVTTRRARPRPPAHTEIEQPAAIEPEPQPVYATRPKGQGMSLSTPNKRKLADFEGFTDEEQTPARQISREQFGNRDSEELADVLLLDDDLKHAVVDDGMDERDTIKMTGYNGPNKGPKIITPVPLPPFITSSTNTSGPQVSKKEPTVVNVGVKKPSKPAPHKEEVVLSIEGGTLPSGPSPVAPAGNGSIAAPSPRTRGSTRELRKSTSMGGTSATSSQKQGRSRTLSTRKKKRPGTPPRPIDISGQGDEPLWAVERLEDMAFYDVENRGLVRYFLVRWAGDWPPEQNPSWEPEDNIPAELIRSYTKMTKKRRAKLTTQNQRPPPDDRGRAAERRYRSVSEAFEGDAEQDAPLSGAARGHAESQSLDNKVHR